MHDDAHDQVFVAFNIWDVTITFKIDSHTIKRGETRFEMRLSKCHYML
jgi:hypothetical protein